jgi:hypothetical protein
MPFLKGDHAIMTQLGADQLVEIFAVESDAMAMIKNKGAFSPCPLGDLVKPYVLTDPQGKNVDSGGPIFVQPDGQTTGDLDTAKLFKSPKDAEEFRDRSTGIPYFVPRPYDDFVTTH